LCKVSACSGLWVHAGFGGNFSRYGAEIAPWNDQMLLKAEVSNRAGHRMISLFFDLV
jgi:hypothetical protein